MVTKRKEQYDDLPPEGTQEEVQKRDHHKKKEPGNVHTLRTLE